MAWFAGPGDVPRVQLRRVPANMATMTAPMAVTTAILAWFAGPFYSLGAS